MNANEIATIRAMTDQYVERYNRVRADFLARFETNPISALEWKSGDMAQAQAAFELVMPIIAHLDDKGDVPAADLAIGTMVHWMRSEADRLTDRLTDPSSSKSTSPWDNAIEDQKTVAMAQVRKSLLRVIKKLTAIDF
jgi:pantoate kinase